jgi:hypothetical protein
VTSGYTLTLPQLRRHPELPLHRLHRIRCCRLRSLAAGQALAVAWAEHAYLAEGRSRLFLVHSNPEAVDHLCNSPYRRSCLWLEDRSHPVVVHILSEAVRNPLCVLSRESSSNPLIPVRVSVPYRVPSRQVEWDGHTHLYSVSALDPGCPY